MVVRTLHKALIAGAVALALSAGTAAADGPKVTAKKTASGPVVAGQPLTWTVSVTNAGDLARNVVISDVVPAGFTGIGVKSDSYDCAVTGSAFRCLAKELAPGVSTITVHAIAATAAVAPKRASVAARHASPPGTIETVSSLRVTIGELEREIATLSASLEQSRTLSADLAVEIDALKATAEQERKRSASELAQLRELEGQLAGEQGGKTSLAAQLKEAQAKLAANETAMAGLREMVKSESGRADGLAAELAKSNYSLAHASQLSFVEDCPDGADSPKWLRMNLPALLEHAIDNPTMANARSFLCAQKAATTRDTAFFYDRPAAPRAPSVNAPLGSIASVTPMPVLPVSQGQNTHCSMSPRWAAVPKKVDDAVI